MIQHFRLHVAMFDNYTTLSIGLVPTLVCRVVDVSRTYSDTPAASYTKVMSA